MTTRGDRKTFRNEDLVLKVTSNIDPSIWDETKIRRLPELAQRTISCPKKAVWNFEALKTPAFIEAGEFQTPFFGQSPTPPISLHLLVFRVGTRCSTRPLLWNRYNPPPSQVDVVYGESVRAQKRGRDP